MKKRLLTVLATGTVLTLGAYTTPVHAEDLDQEIDASIQKAESIQSEKTAVQAKLAETTANFSKVQDDISKALATQAATLENTKELQGQIDQATKIIAERQTKIDSQMRSMQTTGSRSYVDYILSSDSITDGINRIEVVAQVISSNNDLLAKQKADKKALEAKKLEQEDNLAKQKANAAVLVQLEQELNATIASYENNLNALSEEERATVIAQNDLLAKKEELEKQVAAETSKAIEETAAVHATVAANENAEVSEVVTPAVATDTTNEITPTEEVVVTPTSNEEPAATTTTNEEKPSSTVGDKQAAIAAAALAQLGVGQDCTMLVTNSLATVGIHYHNWPIGYMSLGHVVSASEAVPGDLIYYDDAGVGVPHIAVYIGGGQAVHGGWQGSTKIATAYAGAPTFIRVH